ncbi:MAG TPA: 5,6-dimethylbenzimidazole synthase [Vicinamibacterales bacterium]|jgi:5,6-dimethylbenzimidazole synthase|nr:5,6-dimethylbenzimidazole synthase [Vicinamibacterales bacterium]
MHQFPDEERRGVYRAIFERRDVRSHFIDAPIPNDVLARILTAAHHAPSVGFMQPWEFIIVSDRDIRSAIHDRFCQANQSAASAYSGERQRLYSSLKLEAILDSAVNVCVTCNPTVTRGHGLGRQTMPETVMYSAVCAIQNCWLAARAEGVGVGWVSILNPDELREILNIPSNIVPVGYLCLGYVSRFDDEPELETKGWERRVPLADALHFDRYGATDSARAAALLRDRE